MAILSFSIAALALAAFTAAAPADLPQRRDGVNGDIAQFSLGWSTCAGTVAALSSGSHLEFQSDGNLVLYFSGGISFNSGFSDPSLPCANPCNCRLILQGDGNLVTYINYGQPNQAVGWNSGTAGVSPKTGSTASYFEVFGNQVAINNFPFVAVVDSKGYGLFSTELDAIPGTGPMAWCPGRTLGQIVLVNGVTDSRELDDALNSYRADLFSTFFLDSDVRVFDFFAEDIEQSNSSYLISDRPRSIIGELQKSKVSLLAHPEPAAVVFLSKYDWIYACEAEHPDYQWLAYGVVGLHFFDSACCGEPQQWNDFLVRVLALRGTKTLNLPQLFTIFPNELSQAEREFAPVSQGFNISLHNELELQSSLDRPPDIWEFDKEDPRLNEVLRAVYGDLRTKSIRQQRGFQTLQRFLSPHTASLGLMKPLAIEQESMGWILGNQAYKDWTLSTNPTVLELTGAPGSGTSQICSNIISTLVATDKCPQAFVITFRFDRWDLRRNSAQAFVSSLIRQLLTLDPSLYRMVQNVTDLIVLQSNVGYDQLLDLLSSILSKVESSQNVFLIINSAGQHIQSLESTIVSLVTDPLISCRLKILVTTYTPLSLPEDVSSYSIPISNSDDVGRIQNTINQRVTQITIRNPAWKDSEEAIVQKLCRESCTLIEATLNLGILEDGLIPSTREGIEGFLSQEQFQRGGTLEEVVNESQSQDKSAVLLLNWVFHALRPLTVPELAVALTLTPDRLAKGTSTLDVIHDEAALTRVRDLVRSMNMLKLVNGEVVPIHHTAHSYLKARRLILASDFHSFATRCCLSYLLACSSHKNSIPNSGGGGVATTFLEYAETVWPDHYRAELTPTQALDDEVAKFLTSCTWWAKRYADIFKWRIDLDLDNILLLASHLGFLRIVEQIASNEDAHTVDQFVAALSASVRVGDAKVFRYLLAKIPPDTDLTAVLGTAAEYGRLQIIRLLMNRDLTPFQLAPDNQENSDPLFLAAMNAHSGVVEPLLSQGRPITAKEAAQDGEALPRFQTNVLHLAAQLGDVGTLSSLRRLRPNEFDALLESQNSEGKSPLELSCISGSLRTFDFLLNVLKPHENAKLQKLLYIAASQGHIPIVNRLISSGVPIIGGTPGTLETAVLNRHYAVVSKLVEEGNKVLHSPEIAESDARVESWKEQLALSFDTGIQDPLNYDYRIVSLLAPYRRVKVENEWRAISRAFHNDHLDIVKHIRSKYISTNGISGDLDQRFLDLAVRKNRPDIIHFLMDQGIDVGVESIHDATRRNHVLCVHELLRQTPQMYKEHSRNINWIREEMERRYKLWEVFEVAVKEGVTTVAKVLLSWGNSDMSSRLSSELGYLDREPADFLNMALRSGKLDLIRLLLDNGCTTNHTKPTFDHPPLHVAIRNGNDDIIKLLLDKSANPNIKDNGGENSLHAAVRFKSRTSIETLLQHNADASAINLAGLSPLHLAVMDNESSLVAALLGFRTGQHDEEGTYEAADGNKEAQNAHPDIDAQDPKSGMTPLGIAIRNCNLPIVHMLLTAGANPNGPGGTFGSLINVAILVGDLEIIETLLSWGANVETMTARFGGPFHALQQYGVLTPRQQHESLGAGRVANLLLEYKADIDAPDNAGISPLAWMIMNGEISYAELLLDIGADPKKVDNAGMTCIHYAASWGSESLIKKLIGAGLDPCIPDSSGEMPLYRAALEVKGNKDSSQSEVALDRFNAILDALPDEDKNRQLELAVTAVLKGGSTELFNDITSSEDLNLNVPDNNGWTALDIAGSSPTLTEEFKSLKRKRAMGGSGIREPTRLVQCTLSYNVSISQDGREAWINGYNANFVPRESAIAIGLVNEGLDLTGFVGRQNGSWSYQSGDLSIIFKDETAAKVPPYQAGNIVSVSINMARRQASFALDGAWRSETIEIYGQVYPAVSFEWFEGGISKVKINFGPEKGGTEFKYKPREDCVEIAPTTGLPSLEGVVG
ncbi:hypothetical protein O1611_g4529 [Lasiodiplodia mahajangana]|uniref:Uncharacterized protein n=1 Tax=Lasiodiplodia mahajangana TaxID=1108764 RepID=A0ACC2JPC6_9PEZI|nr:hypothetical protein O1611_g4529 [Lasiodiplodia mahajangana]